MLAAFALRWWGLSNMTAIFLNDILLFTVKMPPAQAKQAMQKAFSDSGELPLVFAEIPLL